MDVRILQGRVVAVLVHAEPESHQVRVAQVNLKVPGPLVLRLDKQPELGIHPADFNERPHRHVRPYLARLVFPFLPGSGCGI